MKILDAYVEGINEYIAQAARGEVPLPAGFADLGIKAPGAVAARPTWWPRCRPSARCSAPAAAAR